MAEFDQTLFDAWLQANSPAGARPVSGLSPEIAFLSSAMGDVPVVVSSALTGAQSQQALAADNAYVAAPPDKAVEALKQSPATGCTMIMTLAREASGFNPTIPAQAGSLEKFMAYVDQILRCPIFSAVYRDRVQPVYSGDWNSVINSILSFYVGIPARDLDTIRQSLVSAAAAASSNPSTNQKLNVFAQSTVNVDSPTAIDVYLYQTFVQMKTTVTPGGKNEPDRVSNQAYTDLYRVRLLFKSAEWPAQAEKVHQQTQDSLSDWLVDNSAPQGDLPSNWQPR